jgi:leucyl aminopeptidase
MKIFIKNKIETDFACDVLILPLLEDEGITPYKDINKSLNNMPDDIITSGEFNGKLNEVCLIHTGGKIKPDRLLLIGLGKRSEITVDKLRQAGGKASSYLSGLKIKEIALSVKTIASLKQTPVVFLEGALLANYNFHRYKKEENHKEIKKITILTKEKLDKQIKWTEAAVSAAHFARNLVNTPSNDMTPSALVKAARSLKKVSVKVIEKNEAERLGMGAYISVAQGSNEPPKFIVITYKGKNTAPVVLVGKAITFDSGGISIKPSEGMEKMKYDMAGSAAVLDRKSVV